MQSSFVIDTASKNSFANKTLLIDTNALIDAFRLPAEFYDLAAEFAQMGCDLITTKTIATEFLGGTTDESNINTKKQFLEITFGKTLDKIYLPLERSAPKVDELLAYSRQANKFSIADFELFCTLKKYGKNIALVTRNHKDFPVSLIPRVSFITLLGNAIIHTYGVYAFD